MSTSLSEKFTPSQAGRGIVDYYYGLKMSISILKKSTPSQARFIIID